MNNKSIIAIVVYNTLSLAMWIGLAMYFNHWWIALFSILFLTYPTAIHKHYRTCDGCGKKSKYADSEEEALQKAKADGWTHIVSNNTDYCPECSTNLGWKE